MTVADMEAHMTNSEFVGWSIYYARQAQRREVEEKLANAPKPPPRGRS